jgi:hypothetical protein
MPPLPEVGRAHHAESTGSALMSALPWWPSPRKSTHLRQGSGRAASPAPRSSLHEQDEALQRSLKLPGCLMSLAARPGPLDWLPAPFGLGDSDRAHGHFW